MDTMNEPLTDRQRQVLDFIHSHQRQQGVSPSLREIQAHFGLASPFGVKRHVDALTEKGALRRLEGKARGLLPASHPRRGALAEIPLFGTIPAGLPVEFPRKSGPAKFTLDAQGVDISTIEE